MAYQRIKKAESEGVAEREKESEESREREKDDWEGFPIDVGTREGWVLALLGCRVCVRLRARGGHDWSTRFEAL